MKILLIGNGAWGKNYIKCLNIIPNINLEVATKENWKSLVDNGCDGVIIATQPQHHIEIAKYVLDKHIPVMIEKPLALSLSDSLELKKYNTPILVNHIHLFSNTYQEIKNKVNINNIQSITSVGQGFNQARDYNDLWDYGPHDVSMILDLVNEFPKNIKCTKLKERSYLINLKFKRFQSNSIIGFNNIKNRYFEVNDGNHYVYNGLLSNENILLNAINVFLNSIKGKYDYRIGLDLTFKVIGLLELC